MRLRLLYVESTMAIYGGMERVLTDKLNWLCDNIDCDICLLAVNQGSNPLAFSLHPKVEFHDLGIMLYQVYRYTGLKRIREIFRKKQLLKRKLSDYINDFSPHVIVCPRWEFVPDIVKMCNNIPVVFESHISCLAYQFDNYDWVNRFRIRHSYCALKNVEMIISLTRRGDAKEWMKINPNVRVIPNVVHLNTTGSVSDCRSKSAIFVGRYCKQKDIWMLLQIWELVQQRHPDWTLHMFGGYGDQNDMLLSEIRKKKDLNIVIHQPTASIGDEYLKSSMLLMTSRFEPFGLVLPEAMSYGLPVVAFDCPYGPADIITDGVDGFLVKNRNAEEYANVVCRLMEDDSLRREIGKAGAKSAQRYSSDKVMPMWVDLFKSLVK